MGKIAKLLLGAAAVVSVLWLIEYFYDPKMDRIKSVKRDIKSRVA